MSQFGDATYKSKLQEFCQKRLWPLPQYTTVMEGRSHDPNFKATVFVNGLSFQTTGFFKRAKIAQSQSAKLALLHYTSAQDPMNPENYGIYKSQLQELCRKRAWPSPEYTTLIEGPPHVPCYKATVRVNGLSFQPSTFFKHAKVAHSEAAKLAMSHFNSSVPSQVIGETDSPAVIAASAESPMERRRATSSSQVRDGQVARLTTSLTRRQIMDKEAKKASNASTKGMDPKFVRK